MKKSNTQKPSHSEISKSIVSLRFSYDCEITDWSIRKCQSLQIAPLSTEARKGLAALSASNPEIFWPSFFHVTNRLYGSKKTIEALETEEYPVATETRLNCPECASVTWEVGALDVIAGLYATLMRCAECGHGIAFMPAALLMGAQIDAKTRPMDA